jgi:hypothetical protein
LGCSDLVQPPLSNDSDQPVCLTDQLVRLRGEEQQESRLEKYSPVVCRPDWILGKHLFEETVCLPEGFCPIVPGEHAVDAGCELVVGVVRTSMTFESVLLTPAAAT